MTGTTRQTSAAIGGRHAVAALCVVLALAACTRGDEEGTGSVDSVAPPTGSASVTETPASGGSPAEALNAALGGTQAVQDFVIHLEFARVTDGEWVSFYDAVLEQASEDLGDPIELTGGFTLEPVTALEGVMVDEVGGLLPSLSIDFAVLRQDARTIEAVKAALVDGVEDPGVRHALSALPVEGPGLLLEIVTADFAERRLHVGPGDRSEIDVTFVDAVEVGDQVASVHLFGQTIPGDPEREARLDPVGLFVDRWRRGLFYLAGDDDGLQTTVDTSVTIAEGSKIMTREQKRALLSLEMGLVQSQERQELTDVVEKGDKGTILIGGIALPIDEEFASAIRDPARRSGAVRSFVAGLPPEDAPSDENNYQIFLISDEGELSGCSAPCLEGPTPRSGSSFLAAIGAPAALRHCRKVASKLNQYNKTHGAVWRWTTDGDYTVERAVPKARNLGNEPDEFVLPGPGPVSCGPEPAEPYRPEGQFLTAVLGGDVHLRTFDGRSYENQATGEFLVYEDPATVIQARLEPWPGQDSASIATAVAVQVDGLVVSMHLGGGTWIDGASAELPRGEAVAFGEAELLRWLQGWVIVSPDGTVVRIQDVGTAVVLLVTPAGTDSVGLLGGMDGDPDNDFVTRDGRQLPADADADFDGFYAPGGFVDSWRISSGESLFHYEPGEATESFVIAGFPAVPSHEVEFTFEDLSRAEETCSAAGVTRTDALEDCLYDVAITGHSSFAFAALVAQEATPDDPAGGAGTGVEVTRPSVDGGSIVVFDDVVIEFGSDPPIQDPSGVRPRWQCTSDDGSFFATSRFAETPTRMLDIAIEYLDGSRNNTGEDRLSVIVKLNDEDYAWALSYDDRFADLSIDFDGTSLRAGGSGFLNEPLDTRLHPIVVLPDDAELSTFALEATCGG